MHSEDWKQFNYYWIIGSGGFLIWECFNNYLILKVAINYYFDNKALDIIFYVLILEWQLKRIKSTCVLDLDV